MIKNFFKSVLAIAVIVLVSSCNNSGYEKHESGLEYKYFSENADSALAQVGQVVHVNLDYFSDKDSLLFSTNDIPNAFRIMVEKPTHTGGSFEDGVALLHIGDSTEFNVVADSFFVHTMRQERPEFIVAGTKLKFRVKLIDIQTMEEIEKEMALINEKGAAEEQKLLADYLQKNNIKQTPTGSGIYMIQTSKGKGKESKVGLKAKVHYKGYFFNGEVFDSSYDRNEPFEFIVGIGQVIPAWDEAFSKMRVGDKYTVIAPSNMAYGPQGYMPVIPPFSTLLFDIELLDVFDSPDAVK